jgi:hypothetical protein
VAEPENYPVVVGSDRGDVTLDLLEAWHHKY